MTTNIIKDKGDSGDLPNKKNKAKNFLNKGNVLLSPTISNVHLLDWEIKQSIETLAKYYEDYLEENATCGGCSYWGNGRVKKEFEKLKKLFLSSQRQQVENSFKLYDKKNGLYKKI